MTTHQRNAFKAGFKTGAILLAFTLIFTGVMASVYYATQDTIAQSAQAEKLRLISEVLPPTGYDNALMEDYLDLPPTPALGLKTPSRVYRARKAGQPYALILEARSAEGYSGDIFLLVAVDAAGKVLGVRVTQHKETPGLGDYIDPKKDKNKARPWIAQFEGRSHENPTLKDWRVKKDGGAFDYMTGATISARAVTEAVGEALAFARDHRESLFATRSP